MCASKLSSYTKKNKRQCNVREGAVGYLHVRLLTVSGAQIIGFMADITLQHLLTQQQSLAAHSVSDSFRYKAIFIAIYGGSFIAVS